MGINNFDTGQNELERVVIKISIIKKKKDAKRFWERDVEKTL